MRIHGLWMSVFVLAACGRGGLLVDPLGDGGDSGVGGSSAANGTGSGVGGVTNGPGSGPSGPGSGPSGPGSGPSGPGSGPSGSGSGASGPGSGPSGSGGSPSGQGAGGGQQICAGFGDSCTECASTGCPDIWCDCLANPDCLGLFSCFDACMGDPACEQGCLTTHEDGISNVLLVSGCAGTTCSGSCNWGNPGFNPCQECIYQDCSTEMNACFANPDCGPLWQCLYNCPEFDLTCQQGCYDTYPAGVQLLENALMCINAACQSPCQ